MRAVAQRVRDGEVRVGQRVTGAIRRGLLVYLGVGKGDTEKDSRYLADKIMNLRIFQDEAGKMNLSIRDVGGEILVVSQFTLYGDVRDGRRPSYTDAAEPPHAEALYRRFIEALSASGMTVACGEFAASMEVSSVNLGPVTILIDTEKKF